MDIQLNNLFSFYVSGICHIDGDGDRIIVGHFTLAEPQIAVCEGCIGEPVAKWKCYIHLLLVIIAVTHEDPLIINDVFSLAKGEVGRIVREFVRQCLGKLAGWVDPAE